MGFFSRIEFKMRPQALPPKLCPDPKLCPKLCPSVISGASRPVREELPHEGGHVTASLASASPVTDGERLFAYFGSWGLYCLDFDGNLKWATDLGQLHTTHGHGEGSSPALYGDTLVINWDSEGQSFLVAFDKRTGKERWKVKRDVMTSWSTPLIVNHKSKPQVIVSGSKRVKGYDLATGKVIWECGGMSV